MKEDRTLLTWFGLTVLIIMIFLVITLGGLGVLIYKSWSSFIASIFPEIFGTLFFALVFVIFLVFNKRGNQLYYFLKNNLDHQKEPSTQPISHDFTSQIKTLEELSNSLKSKLMVNSSNEKLQEYSTNWHSWRDELIKEDHDYSEALSSAWKELIEAHLDLENEYLRSRRIKNTSDSFTILISNLSKILHKEYIGVNNKEYKLVRYHITGMLPEEFFNGPQIEYTQFNSTPILFCHAFENEKYQASHYNFETEKKELDKLEVNRCVVVREPSKHLDNVFNALSTLSELKEQKNLSIFDSHEPRRMTALVDDNKDFALSGGESSRLLSKCSHHVDRLTQSNAKNKNFVFIKNIINNENYKYFSIVPSSLVKDKTRYVNLFTYFATFFSRKVQDVYFYSVNDHNDDMIKKYFKSGYMPEIVFFALVPEDGSLTSAKWLLGLHGQYKPFTREIEIEILKPSDTKSMAEELVSLMFVKHLNTI